MLESDKNRPLATPASLTKDIQAKQKSIHMPKTSVPQKTLELQLQPGVCFLFYVKFFLRIFLGIYFLNYIYAYRHTLIHVI